MNKGLKKILIKTKKQIFSQKIGNNTSKFKGEGYDFVELREYEDGEDIRKIDWVISAKMQKPYVKVFHTQRELDINIVSLLSGSIHFGTTKFKQEVIAEIVSLLGYSCAAQGDTYTSFIANEKVVLHTRKTKKILAVEKMAHDIYHYDCIGKKVDYKHIVTELYQKIPKKSILFLIGDFFDAQNLDLKLLSKKHELIAIIVRDRFEENPVSMGNVHFTDPTNATKFEGNLSRSVVEKYKKTIATNDQFLYENFKKSGIEFVKIYTCDNVALKIMKLFK